ncbi:MAG: hypothetical protein RML12_03770 [Xanthomonadales bacterium]|nr:hypothetical protein [Xanthomonadales bacterium]
MAKTELRAVQTQRQQLSQQMRQALRLLALAQPELEAELREAALANPVLELEELGPGAQPGEDAGGRGAGAGRRGRRRGLSTPGRAPRKRRCCRGRSPVPARRRIRPSARSPIPPDRISRRTSAGSCRSAASTRASA